MKNKKTYLFLALFFYILVYNFSLEVHAKAKKVSAIPSQDSCCMLFLRDSNVPDFIKNKVVNFGDINVSPAIKIDLKLQNSSIYCDNLKVFNGKSYTAKVDADVRNAFIYVQNNCNVAFPNFLPNKNTSIYVDSDAKLFLNVQSPQLTFLNNVSVMPLSELVIKLEEL